jgi:2-methylisocitrate lyase-like PEP mutase family enzyme
MRLRDRVIEGKASSELRRLLREEALPIMAVGGAIPNHAQLAEATGYKLFSLSGSQASSHLLGLPDAGLMTLSEVTDNVRNICQSVSIPVFVDGDAGFGGLANVARLASDLIDAGVAGFYIEDQVTPKRCGHMQGIEIVTVQEAVSKLKVAMEVRDAMDPDVVVMARTDSYAAANGGPDETLRRAEAYLGAGVDMLMLTALKTREEVRAVRERFPQAHLELNVNFDPPLSHEEQRELRIAFSTVSIAKLGQIMMYDLLMEIGDGGLDTLNTFTQRNKNHPFGMFGFLGLTGVDKIVELEKRHLGAEGLRKYERTGGRIA